MSLANFLCTLETTFLKNKTTADTVMDLLIYVAYIINLEGNPLKINDARMSCINLRRICYNGFTVWVKQKYIDWIKQDYTVYLKLD